MTFTQIKEYIDMAGTAFMAVSILATLVARFTPTKADDIFIGTAVDRFLKLVNVFPIIGVSNRSKVLEQIYKDISKDGEIPVLPKGIDK